MQLLLRRIRSVDVYSSGVRVRKYLKGHLLALTAFIILSGCKEHVAEPVGETISKEEEIWKAPDTSTIPDDERGDLIRYGLELVSNTAYYLGPKGKVARITNGMNCQNCHLEAGTRPWGNNYGRATATFPNYRHRSGTIETLTKRVNDCIERSLNGKPIDSNSKEMKAMLSYMTWLGNKVPKGASPPGTGIRELEYLERPADPANGSLVYRSQCQRCHGKDGGGTLNADAITYQYPPLWGDHSYTTAAGLHRLSRMAGFIKENMPFDSAKLGRELSIGDAWDVAAFINSQPRPNRTFKEDWPDISSKPPDHPFGPFIDSLPPAQHKYGPFGPILKIKQDYKEKKLSVSK